MNILSARKLSKKVVIVIFLTILYTFIAGYLIWRWQVTISNKELAARQANILALEQAKNSQSQTMGDSEYEKAVAQYTKRFQFNKCMGTPVKITLKTGDQFMLDNRNDQTHVFGVGEQKITVKPYGFSIVTADGLGIQTITCDGGGSIQLDVRK